MKLRKILASDLAQVAAICDYWKSAHFNWPAAKLATEIDNSEGFVMEAEGGKLGAFVLMRSLPDSVELTVLAVASNNLRNGSMSLLMEHLIDAHGKQREFWLEVHEQNLAARNFYEKWSFELVGRRQKYYADGGAAILYSRRISKGPCVKGHL